MGLEVLSPLVAMVTGKGAMGKAISEGVGGVIPALIARSARESDEEEEKRRADRQVPEETGMKKGGVTKMKKGGMTASKRADGCAQRGKTRGKMV